MARRIRAVVFDAVGTLMRSEPSIGQVYAAAGRDFGSRYDETTVMPRFLDSFRRHFGAHRGLATSDEIERNRWRDIVGEVFDDVADARDGLFERLWEHFARGASWRVFPDVAPTWDALAKTGVTIAIGSNYDSRLRRVCRELTPLHDCSHVFHSSQVGWAKPSVEFFRAVERELGLSPDELLFVGDDRVNDCEGPLEAGWLARWLVRDGRHDGPHVIRSLQELATVV